ncbi:hypothetical protein AeMF1_002407 [Aphanomyces euteiches]|nr:hypothetical protein AeMF1_002407 [Aphanomyces euteiches]KAH9193583.1 hypothetical protein AeNC1_004437 [Aphanomyces euteiches]
MACALNAWKILTLDHVVSFEELLEREWRSSESVTANSAAPKKDVQKKPFLKRGARGWWKSSDKAKAIAYTLSSTDEASSTDSKTPAQVSHFAVQREEQKPPRFMQSTETTTSRNNSTILPARIQSPKDEVAKSVVAKPNQRDRLPLDWSFNKASDLEQLGLSYEWKAQQDTEELEEFEHLEQAIYHEENQHLRRDTLSPRHDLLAELDEWKSEELNASPLPEDLSDSEEELGFSSMQYFSGTQAAKPKDDLLESLNLSFADSEPWEDSSAMLKPPPPPPLPETTQEDRIGSVGSTLSAPDVRVAPPSSSSSQPRNQAIQQPPPLSSLQTLKMKLQQKSAPKSTSQKPKSIIKPMAKHKPEPSPKQPSPPKPTSSHREFPSAINDKLNELEQEVKHYKQETLKLQKRREALELEQRKLDHSRQEWLEEKRKAQEAIDAEWKLIRKEKRAVEQTLKISQGVLPDRKERSEIEALKAQIVKMKMDDKTRTNKHKAATDFFRHRIAVRTLFMLALVLTSLAQELELRNQELRDEIKFMEQERLANWNWAADNDTRPKSEPFVSHVHDDEDYNPTRYQEQPEELFEHGQDAHVEHEDVGRKTTAQAAVASVEKDDDQEVARSTPIEDARRNQVSLDESQEAKPTEIHHPGGKIERRYLSGPISKSFVFANGTEKDVYVDGHSIVRFSNGDVKEAYPNDGKTVYYYAAAETRHTTYADQTQVFEFPNGQVEKHYANGMKEITFVDGTSKRIEVNGDEYSTFPDGTRMVEKKSGFREVINPDGSKARDYPDGRTVWVTASGVEQPVQYKRP